MDPPDLQGTLPMLRATVAALAFGALPAHAEMRQFGNMIYELPPDWLHGTAEGGVKTFISSLPDDVCEFCYVYLATGIDTDDDAIAVLTAHTDRFVDAEERDDVRVIQPASGGSEGGRQMAMAGIMIGSSTLQVVIAVDLGPRVELMAFEGEADDEEEIAESMRVFGEQILPMVLSIAYVSEGAAPLMPAPVPGDLSGLYWGWRTEWLMGIDGMMRMETDYRTLIFWPNGHFYDGTPPGGLRPLDPDALMAAADESFGVYTVQGDRLRLTYVNGETDELAADGADWMDGDRQMFEVKPLRDGTTISGSISSVFYSGFTPGIGMSGGMSAFSSVTFHPDGSYEDTRMGGASATYDTGGGFATSSEDQGRGTYAIRDGLLTMIPDDGSEPTAQLAFSNGTDIMIGTSALE
jgi:hypothetical protein